MNYQLTIYRFGQKHVERIVYFGADTYDQAELRASSYIRTSYGPNPKRMPGWTLKQV